jgi:hypothetical protein
MTASRFLKTPGNSQALHGSSHPRSTTHVIHHSHNSNHAAQSPTFLTSAATLPMILPYMKKRLNDGIIRTRRRFQAQQPRFHEGPSTTASAVTAYRRGRSRTPSASCRNLDVATRLPKPHCVASQQTVESIDDGDVGDKECRRMSKSESTIAENRDPKGPSGQA